MMNPRLLSFEYSADQNEMQANFYHKQLPFFLFGAQASASLRSKLMHLKDMAPHVIQTHCTLHGEKQGTKK